MTINVGKNGTNGIITVSGRLDALSAPALDKAINQDVEGVTNLILDLQGLEYISSAGLRVLLSAQKKMQKIGSMKLCGVREAVMEVLDMTGFSDILTIE